MDISTKSLENINKNIELLISKGYILSSVSKRNGINKVIRYSEKRKVYWFTDKFIARIIEGNIYRTQVGTLYIN